MLDCVLDTFYLRRTFYAHGQAVVGSLGAGAAQNASQIVGLRDAQSFSYLQWNQKAAASKSTDAGSWLGLYDSDDVERFLFRND